MDIRLRAMPSAVRKWTLGERRLISLLHREIGARWGHCYGAAQRAVLLAADIGIEPARLTYCEGFASLGGLAAPFAHAWCLLNEQVWDPIPQFQDQSVEYLGEEVPTDVLQRALAGRRAWSLAVVGT